MTTLMLCELNERPTVQTLSVLVSSLSRHMFDVPTLKSVVGSRVAVELTTCHKAFTRHISTRKFTVALDKAFLDCLEMQELLLKSGSQEISTDDQVESVGRLVYDALTIWTNIRPDAGDEYCDEDEGMVLCDYHTALIDLRNASLTIAMLTFQRDIFVSHVTDKDGNRKSAQDRVAEASAQVIKVWRAYPQLRASVDSIQPFIELEPTASQTTYKWSDDAAEGAEERPRFTQQAE